MSSSQAALSSSSLTPPQPVYVLRGHGSAIHALKIFHNNLRLISGDADGWVVVWDLATKLPVAVWQAHDASILGVDVWAADKIITHGRDGKLLVWAFGEEVEQDMSKDLPIDNSTAHRRPPWLLHSLSVNTVNFCAFSSCRAELSSPSPRPSQTGTSSTDLTPSTRSSTSTTTHPILVAVTGLTDSQIDIHCLPSESHLASIPAPTNISIKTGMVMALRLFHRSQRPTLVAGYESGRVCAFRATPDGTWRLLYTAAPHGQPVLSLDVAPSMDTFFSSAADALIVRHPVDPAADAARDMKVVKTGHAGQQGLSVRGDGRVFATAGWDGRGRVYTVKGVKEVAVLKWHRDGCYAVAFGEVDAGSREAEQQGDEVVAATQTVARKTARSLRVERTRNTHWIALGAKDGKVSLWDIY